MSISDWGWTESGIVQIDQPDTTPKSAKRVRFEGPSSASSVAAPTGLYHYIREMADTDWGWTEWGMSEYHLDLQDYLEMEQLKEFELIEAMMETEDKEEQKELAFQNAMADAEREDELLYLDLQDERDAEDLREFEWQEALANSQLQDDLL